VTQRVRALGGVYGHTVQSGLPKALIDAIRTGHCCMLTAAGMTIELFGQVGDAG
jgi:hypothetical protein